MKMVQPNRSFNEEESICPANGFPFMYGNFFAEESMASKTSKNQQIAYKETLISMMPQANSFHIQMDSAKKEHIKEDNIEKLTQLFLNKKKNEAIELMRKLNHQEAYLFLGNENLKKLVFKNLDNKELLHAIIGINYEFEKRLIWLFEKECTWEEIRLFIEKDFPDKDRIYPDSKMFRFFSETCNDEQFAEAVEYIGGKLYQKLVWMINKKCPYELIKKTIASPNIIISEKIAIYGNEQIINYFKEKYNNKQLLEITILTGGTWKQKSILIEPVSAQLQEMLGQKAKWWSSGTTSTTGFARWARTPIDSDKAIDQTSFNCWEAILIAAYRAGVIDKKWIHNLYTTNTSDKNWKNTWINKFASKRKRYTEGKTMLNRGDWVFFNNLDHVALATGRNDDIFSFMPPRSELAEENVIGFYGTDRIKIETIRNFRNSMPGKVIITYASPEW